MNGYWVEFARPARKELERLPARAVERIVAAIRGLRGNPRPVGVAKLQGVQDTFRIRVGPYRVVFEIDDERRAVLVTRVRHRQDVYE